MFTQFYLILLREVSNWNKIIRQQYFQEKNEKQSAVGQSYLLYYF